MTPIVVGLVGFIVLFALLAMGLPVGFGLALVGCLGLWYFLPPAAVVTKVASASFVVISSYDYAVLPLFLLMAYSVSTTGIVEDFYNLVAKWLGHHPGGIALATVGACAGFAAVSASSLATAAAMGQVAIPEMKKYRYSPELAVGCVTAGGTMGSLIPPSAMLIIYGILTETSIGALFIAGIVPGIIEAAFYMGVIFILCRWKPAYGPPGPRFNFRERVTAFGRCGEIIGLIVLVLAGIILGWFTPTEAGAVGACGALVFPLIRGRLTWQKFRQALIETLKTTGMAYGILIGAFIFTPFVALTTIPTWLANFVSGLIMPPLAIMGFIILIYILLGCIMDVMAMILLTLPIFFPLAISLGFDPIWFGIIIVAISEIASITPPIGINLFVVAAIAPDVPMQTIFKGVLPFVIADFIRVAIYTLFPAVVLFLPSLMFR